MKTWKEYEKDVPENFISDGCTNVPDFGVRSCCVLHDYLLRENVVSEGKADKILMECIKERGGILSWFLAPLYGYGAKLLRNKLAFTVFIFASAFACLWAIAFLTT